MWLPDLGTQGIVNDRVQTRSYSVSTPKGQVRRNRKHLDHLPDENHVTEAEKQMEVPPQPNQVEVDMSLDVALAVSSTTQTEVCATDDKAF